MRNSLVILVKRALRAEARAGELLAEPRENVSDGSIIENGRHKLVGRDDIEQVRHQVLQAHVAAGGLPAQGRDNAGIELDPGHRALRGSRLLPTCVHRDTPRRKLMPERAQQHGPPISGFRRDRPGNTVDHQ
jgi:hypothetical protein